MLIQTKAAASRNCCNVCYDKQNQTHFCIRKQISCTAHHACAKPLSLPLTHFTVVSIAVVLIISQFSITTRFTNMDISVFKQIQAFLVNGELPPTRLQRQKIKRMAPNYKVKGNRLFYTGPTMRFMRLVVMSEEEKRSVLMECHQNSGTENHTGMRGTINKIVAGYYWQTVKQDVDEWVKRCHHCRLNNQIKTVAPVLYRIKVKEPWDVLSMDLIGPFLETAQGNRYILTMTDLFTKWVIAEPLKSKTATEVSPILIKKLYTFGMVKKIITNQGSEFVNQLNDSISARLNINHAVSSEFHPQTHGQNVRTNQNIKRALGKYVNSEHDDWDAHLAAVVYGINTAKQYTTGHTPYFLLFHRHPRLPTVMNVCPMNDSFDIADPEEDMDMRVEEMTMLNESDNPGEN
uniref:Integrase catalytic domain-containing protein n=1 Tax=Oryzias melastigma TaxID=30732 RepID=A0A3B3DAL4_ORYME